MASQAISRSILTARQALPRRRIGFGTVFWCNMSAGEPPPSRRGSLAVPGLGLPQVAFAENGPTTHRRASVLPNTAPSRRESLVAAGANSRKGSLLQQLRHEPEKVEQNSGINMQVNTDIFQVSMLVLTAKRRAQTVSDLSAQAPGRI